MCIICHCVTTGSVRAYSSSGSSKSLLLFEPLMRMRRGKSGSARVVTANAIIAEHEGRIALLTIYDKQDADTVKLPVIRQMARELGFDV